MLKRYLNRWVRYPLSSVGRFYYNYRLQEENKRKLEDAVEARRQERARLREQKNSPGESRMPNPLAGYVTHEAEEGALNATILPSPRQKPIHVL